MLQDPELAVPSPVDVADPVAHDWGLLFTILVPPFELGAVVVVVEVGGAVGGVVGPVVVWTIVEVVVVGLTVTGVDDDGASDPPEAVITDIPPAFGLAEVPLRGEVAGFSFWSAFVGTTTEEVVVVPMTEP